MSHLANLEVLSLRDNAIVDLSALENLNKLHTLDIRQNYIKEIPRFLFERFDSYQYKDIDEDDIIYTLVMDDTDELANTPPCSVIEEGQAAVLAWFDRQAS